MYQSATLFHEIEGIKTNTSEEKPSIKVNKDSEEVKKVLTQKNI